MKPVHKPAMVREVLEYLGNIRGKTVLDLTVGPGGHARHLIASGAFVIGLDRDPEALELARQNLAGLEDRFLLLHGRMSQAGELVRSAGFREVHGALADVGVSMVQLLGKRGFSVHSEEPLDMRLDPTDDTSPTAYDIVNQYLENQLIRVLAVTGRGREARRVAARIVAARRRGPIRTAAQLADLIAATVARGKRGRRIDAAPYLMALRVAVNDELTELRAGIEVACDLLSPAGRLVTLTWQGAEHRAARVTLRRLANPCQCPPSLPCICGKQPIIKLILHKPLAPQPDEVAQNPSARSVRLHVAEKL